MMRQEQFTVAVEKQCQALVEQIRPILGGHAPFVQGLVVAELLAIWLAGHDMTVRDEMLELELSTVRELVPLWDEVLRRRASEEKST